MKLQGRALQQIAAAYALGSLGPLARRRFEALLARQVEARRAWQQWEGRLSALAPNPPPIRPPDKAWQAIEVRVQPPESRPRTSVRRRWLLMTVIVLVFAIALIWVQTVKP